MSVQLLPFQKLVDMPNLAQRHRRAICGLAIASIVLIFLILGLLVWAFASGIAYNVYSTNMLFTFIGIPSMVIVLILVCTSSCISLRNTDNWASTDVCCNLMRPYPTCCTKCCGGNKHSCARMSCLHTAASIWTSLFCVLLVVLLFAGCNETDSIRREYESQYQSGGPVRSLRSLQDVGCLGRTEKNVKVGTRVTLIANREAFQNSFNAVPYIWDDAMTTLLGQTVTVVDRPSSGIFGLPKSDARSGQPVWWYPFSVIACVKDNVATDHQRSETTTTNTATTTTAPRYGYSFKYRYYYYRNPTKTTPNYRYPSTYAQAAEQPSYYEQWTYESAKYSCGVIAGFEIPALVLMICLAIITARSAWLLRKIEQGQPEIEMLPAGKMVVQTCEDTVVIQNAHVMNDVNSTPDLKTEQNE